MERGRNGQLEMLTATLRTSAQRESAAVSETAAEAFAARSEQRHSWPSGAAAAAALQRGAGAGAWHAATCPRHSLV
eukprot:6022905-Prymnesium_polylepis.1